MVAMMEDSVTVVCMEETTNQLSQLCVDRAAFTKAFSIQSDGTTRGDWRFDGKACPIVCRYQSTLIL